MSSMAVHRFFPTAKSSSLPVSVGLESEEVVGRGVGLRRRLSSMSLKMQDLPIRRSMSEYAGNSIVKWWEWGWAFILSSTKPIFASDLEMNDHETSLLGSHNRGTWGHLFIKLRSQITRLITSSSHHLPQTYTSSP